MCGIVGAWYQSPRPEEELEREACAMLDAIRHRGPDDGGFAVHPQGFVGNRRLSILDVTQAGNQPFFNDRGTLWLVLNGEIYNFLEIRRELEDGCVFRSNSDTEVLLRAYERWGVSCVERLVGMFAFAVWEPEKKKLTLCRDRLGKKPLYYHWSGSRLLFASEIKSLLAAGVSTAPDVDTWAEYLRDGVYDHSNSTFFEGIRQVERGCFLEIDGEGIRERRYWDLMERIVARDGARFPGVVDEYLHLLDEAVRMRMRMDVPFAVMLSGGLDSSVLAVLAARHASSGLNVMTFRSKDSRYDEGPWADMVLKDRGWKAFATMIDAADVAAMLPLLLWHQEEPFGGVATLADVRLAEFARNKGMYVLLEGQGADETLGGYEYYFAYYLADLEQSDPRAAREVYRAYAGRRDLDPEADFSAMTRPVWREMGGHAQDGTRSTVPEVLVPELLQRGRTTCCRRAGLASCLDGAMYRDLALTKVPRVLRFKDKAHMMYGVELRTPFLDHRLVELAFSIPAAAKLAHGYTKYCLRHAYRTELPRETAFHVKRQVQTPQREWLRTSLKGLVDEVIHADSFAGRGFFDTKKVRRVYADYVDNPERYPNGFFVWQWLMVEWWHRMFVDNGARDMAPSYAVVTGNVRRYPPLSSNGAEI